jgi:hypothetical protein
MNAVVVTESSDWGRVAAVVVACVLATGCRDRGRAAWVRVTADPAWPGEGLRGELRGSAGALGGALLLRRRCRAGGGVQAFGGGAGSGGLGGVPLGVAEFGDGFGERGQPGDQHDGGQ